MGETSLGIGSTRLEAREAASALMVEIIGIGKKKKPAKKEIVPHNAATKSTEAKTGESAKKAEPSTEQPKKTNDSKSNGTKKKKPGKRKPYGKRPSNKKKATPKE